MSRTIALLTGAGLGAGLMYFLDPKNKRQRQAFVRDKMTRFSHEIADACDVVSRDARNRMRGLAAGDMTVLIGGKNALHGHTLRGDWTPTGRALLGMIGGGLLLSGLMKEAPTGCVLGTVGLGLMIEAATNAGIDDITAMPSKVKQMAADCLGQEAERTQAVAQTASAQG